MMRARTRRDGKGETRGKTHNDVKSGTTKCHVKGILSGVVLEIEKLSQ